MPIYLTGWAERLPKIAWQAGALSSCGCTRASDLDLGLHCLKLGWRQPIYSGTLHAATGVGGGKSDTSETLLDCSTEASTSLM